MICPSITLKNIKIGNYFSIPEKLEIKLKEIYNQSQIAAIKETLKKEGITLIQGPPGTGKTTTVLGTISVLLNSLNENMQDILNDSKGKLLDLSSSFQAPKENLMKKSPWLTTGFKDWYIVNKFQKISRKLIIF